MHEGQFEGWLLDEVVRPDAKMRQGDLIRFEGAADAMRRLAIVVTADCDLEHKKHAGILTLVPIVTAKFLIENYLIPEDLERKRVEIERYVFDKMSIIAESNELTKYIILRDRLENSSLDRSSILRIAGEFLIGAGEGMQFQCYSALTRAVGVKGRDISGFKSQLRSRGDLLILPEADCLGIKGHLAWVRHLWQTPVSDVALRTSELSARRGERIARLESPFRYRLTQIMAQVFSDIGLPRFPDSIDEILEEAYRS